MAKGFSGPPDLNTQAGRLRQARQGAGFDSAREAAHRFGWNENTYKSHEYGVRGADGLKTKTAEKYAKAFGVSPEWLMTGRGAVNPTAAALLGLSPEDQELALRLLTAARPGK